MAQERGLVAFGVDLSSSGALLARSFAPGGHVVVGNGEQLPFFDDWFDYLTCLGSLEHFMDIKAGLKEMVWVCKDGARMCVMVPNSFYLFDIIGVLKTGYSRNGTCQPQERLATLGERKDLLEAYGLMCWKCAVTGNRLIPRGQHVCRDFPPNQQIGFL